MSIDVGTVYEFTFKSDFTALNGIYKVSHSLDYDTILLEDISLLDFLYSHVSKTAEDLLTDLSDYRDNVFYKITHVTTLAVYYVPRSYIVGIPNPDVRPYSKLVLTLDLGPFADPDLLVTLKETISQVLSVNTGITESPVIMEYDQEWMTGGAYNDIVDDRAANKGNTINYYSENLKLIQQLTQKNTTIAGMEELIHDLNGTV